MPAFGRKQSFHTHSRCTDRQIHLQILEVFGLKNPRFPRSFCRFPSRDRGGKAIFWMLYYTSFFSFFFSLTKHASFLHKERNSPHFLSYLKCLNRKCSLVRHFPIGHYFLIDCFGTNKHCWILSFTSRVRVRAYNCPLLRPPLPIHRRRSVFLFAAFFWPDVWETRGCAEKKSLMKICGQEDFMVVIIFLKQ